MQTARVGILLGFLLLMTGLLPHAALAQSADADQAQGKADADEEGNITAGVSVSIVDDDSDTSLGAEVEFFWREAGSCPWGLAESDLYEFVEVDRRTSPPTVTVLDTDCRDPVVDAYRDRWAAVPEPPGSSQISDAARDQLPTPQVTLNPDERGLTGLETWFWYEGPTEFTVSAGVGEYRVTARLHAERFVWDPCAGYVPPEDDPDLRPIGCTTVSSTQPGSRPDSDSDGESAAARFTYETKGTYTVALTVQWMGSWSFSGPEGESGSGDLGPVNMTGQRAGYPVVEVRGVLTGGS